jgi:hypothetical protein
VTALVVDPVDHQHIWAGLEVDGVRHSKDGGKTWEVVTSGVTDPDIHNLAIAVRPPKTLLTITQPQYDKGDIMNFMVAQRQAIGFHLANLQLVACAGSEKTEVVAQRVGHSIAFAITLETGRGKFYLRRSASCGC